MPNAASTNGKRSAAGATTQCNALKNAAVDEPRVRGLMAVGASVGDLADDTRLDVPALRESDVELR